MRGIAKRIWASPLFPRYSQFLDLANHAALLKAWIASTELVPLPTKRALYDLVSRLIPPNSPIDYLEFGVYKGETLRLWTELNRDRRSRFIGFDSFSGLPEDWVSSFKRGSFDAGGNPPPFDDPRVEFVKGSFQQSLPGFLEKFLPRSPLIIHHDADLYSSTLYCLTKTDPIVTPGTILICDDFGQPLHEFRAYQDYTKSYCRTFKVLGSTFDNGIPDCVAFIKD